MQTAVLKVAFVMDNTLVHSFGICGDFVSRRAVRGMRGRGHGSIPAKEYCSAAIRLF
jgi:hypothetical protein